MKLIDQLVCDGCVIDMEARTKTDAIRELADRLCRAVPQVPHEELLQTLREREKLGTTALGDGIAIPHARLESVDRLLVSFGRSRNGIDFDSVDGQPTHLFFLLVAPSREGSAHLLTLARLSRFLSNAAFRARLLASESVDDVVRAVEEAESRL
jgi:PTS system nitrogen regulatory IIA component